MRDRMLRILLSIPFVKELMLIAIQNYSKIGHDNNFEVVDTDESKPNWYIRTSVPRNPSAKHWGDYYFATELVLSLKNLGLNATLLFRGDTIKPKSSDVYVVLRGLLPFKPEKNAKNVLWVISHPYQISNRELQSFPFVYAASESWASEKTIQSGRLIKCLLQATNPKKFFPNEDSEFKKINDFVFVGNAHNRKRQLILDVLKINPEISLVGNGWDKSNHTNVMQFIANQDLPTLYRSSRVVLNDHWPDMKKDGFVSNRMYDALACGAVVLTDQSTSECRLFADQVVTYFTKHDISTALNTSKKLTLEQIQKNFKLIEEKFSFDDRAKFLVNEILN